MICGDESITNDCDLDLGRGNLKFVLDTPFQFSFVWHLIKFTLAVLNYCGHRICK